MRQYLEAFPERVNIPDRDNWTALAFATHYELGSLPLVLWLLDEKGADINGRRIGGKPPIFSVQSLDVLEALLDRGADVTLPDDCYDRATLLMQQVRLTTDDDIEIIVRLLQDP